MNVFSRNTKTYRLMCLVAVVGLCGMGCGSKTEEPEATKPDTGKATSVKPEGMAPAKAARPALDNSK